VWRSDTNYDLRLAVQKVWQEMKSLSPEQRRCLEMKIGGYSYDETAARMGLPIEAVKSHLQNGRRMLWLKVEGMLSQLK
jgi:DNA-directed RNA polymerase specialized sigma24 family protein